MQQRERLLVHKHNTPRNNNEAYHAGRAWFAQLLQARGSLYFVYISGPCQHVVQSLKLQGAQNSVILNPCAHLCCVSNDQRAQPEHLLTHRETTMEQTMQAGHGLLHCSKPGAASTVWLGQLICGYKRGPCQHVVQPWETPCLHNTAHTDTTTICTQTQGWRGQ